MKSALPKESTSTNQHPHFNPEVAVCVDVEVELFPITWGLIHTALGTNSTTCRKYVADGLGWMRGRAIDSEEDLELFVKVYLWCRKGANGGRGNAFSPQRFKALLLQEDNLDRELMANGISENRVQKQIQQIRTFCRNRG